MQPEFDLTRLDELQELLGSEMSAIVATLSDELNKALGALDGALAAAELDGVAQAAHDARNSALMIDARPLLGRLSEVESCARAGDLPGTRAAHRGLAEVWPSLRRQLALASGDGDLG